MEDTNLNFRDFPHIRIPGGHDNRFGCGDISRSIFLPGSKFSGAHTDSPEHFENDDYAGVLKVVNVCWLQVGCAIQNVPAGEWEVVLKVKCGNSYFKGDFRVGVGLDWVDGRWPSTENNATYDAACAIAEEASGVRPFLFRTSTRGESTGRSLIHENRNRWISLSFGVLKLPSVGEVCFHLRGDNDWCRNIHLGGLELLAVGLSWEKKRLIVLCKMQRAGEACDLEMLPPEVLNHVLRFLHTPLPEPDDTFFSKKDVVSGDLRLARISRRVA